MAQIQMIQRRQDSGPKGAGGIGGTGISAQDALSAAGIIGGALLAVPTGGLSLAAVPAMVGGAAGAGGLGAMGGALLDKANAPKPVKEAAQAMGISGGGGNSSAITRRLEQIAADNGSRANYDKLMLAEQASAKLPEKERQAYQPVLTQARMLEEQRLRNYYG